MNTEPTRTKPSQATGRSVYIGELAQRLGLTARTLRYWEQRGLIPPAGRTPGGFRAYGAEHERAARSVRVLKAVGFSLDDMRDASLRLASQSTARTGLRHLQADLSRRAEELRRRIAEQTDLLQLIEGASEALDPCTGCDGKRFAGECLPCLESASTCDGLAPIASLLHQANRQDP